MPTAPTTRRAPRRPSVARRLAAPANPLDVLVREYVGGRFRSFADLVLSVSAHGAPAPALCRDHADEVRLADAIDERLAQVGCPSRVQRWSRTDPRPAVAQEPRLTAAQPCPTCRPTHAPGCSTRCTSCPTHGARCVGTHD